MSLAAQHSIIPLPPLTLPMPACPCIPPAQEMEEMEERLRGKTGELDAAQASAEEAAERLEASEARGRDLYEENKRLTEHISVCGWTQRWAK